jgi:hypothetical protein
MPKGTVFDAKAVPKRYTKQSKWNPKGCQNEQRNLQRHPRGTESNKYRKRVPKYSNWGAHFWIQTDKLFKKDIPKTFKNLSWENMNKIVKTMYQGSQKS